MEPTFLSLHASTHHRALRPSGSGWRRARARPHRVRRGPEPNPAPGRSLLRLSAPRAMTRRRPARPAPKDARRYPVLYDLHGLGDNEQSLLNTGAWSLIQDLREQHKIGEFSDRHAGRAADPSTSTLATAACAIAISSCKSSCPPSSTSTACAAGRNARGITGMSMGGYGALRFAFAYPQLFSSVSAHSAALVAKPPRRPRTAAR